MRGRGGGWLRGTTALAACVLVAGCSSGAQDGPAPDRGPATTTAAATTAPDTATDPVDPTQALRERCLSAIPDDADLEALTLQGRTGGVLEAARIGPPTHDTVAVLLPQVGGLCGWGRWASQAADRVGLTSLLVNPCGYGASECPAAADADRLDEVEPAVRLAREQYGASRVVLLGTSMGGSLTVMAVAAGADVDAWVDVSGPPSWEGVDLTDLADDLAADGVPEGLVVMAPSDGRAIFAAARRLARVSGVPFVAGRSGHGWDLLVDPVDGHLTRIGRRLLALATGPGRG
ncbi:alpha/beta hydrolase family protein [Nocardioides zeicaulis]|uniref:Alpha/beta hydrolase family protein n=1 Tax=Nocardioides zeicaulis TaxID=1776857 RepID=A0ABV6E3S6_9ACTN